MVSKSHIRQIVNQLGADITKIDSNEISSTVKAKIEDEQAGGNVYAWSDRVDLQMPAKILTLDSSADITNETIFQFEDSTWWIADTREIMAQGKVTGYRVLVLDSLKGTGAELSDGSDSLEVISAQTVRSPGALKRGDVEIPGSDTNDLQDLGKGNESIDVVIQIGRWTELNGSRAGSIDAVENVLESWHDAQTEIEYTGLDGSTSTVVIEIKEIETFPDIKLALAETTITKVNE